jgi:hypothetical protein
MKKVLSIIAIAMLSNLANAQAFENKGNYVNFGFGLDPTGRVAATFVGYNYYNIGPLVVGYERGITEKLGIGRLGVGGIIGHSFQGEKYGTYKTHWTRTTIIVRCAYHFDFNIDKMDVYAGVGAGLSFVGAEKYDNSTITGTSSSIRGEQYIFAGIRYYFNDNIGVYAEVGEGFMLANGGLVLKF